MRITFALHRTPAQGVMIPQSGWLAKPPVVPGLDIDMNEELIAEHPYKASFVNLSADDRQKRQSAERPLVCEEPDGFMRCRQGGGTSNTTGVDHLPDRSPAR